MKHKKITSLLVTSIVITATFFTGCSKTSTKASNSSKKTVVNLPVSSAVTLDCNKASDFNSNNAIQNSFEGLTRYNYDTKKLEAGIAEKWESSKDGLTWTFHLKNAKWSDGKPVTAQDFEYSWKRLINPKTKALYSFLLTEAVPIKNSSKFFSGKCDEQDVGIKAVDDKTFKVTLEKPITYFETISSFPSLYPLRKDIVEAQGDKYGTDPTKMVYNGPYKIKLWSKGSKIVLNKNDKYWDADTIKIDTVNFMVLKEQSTIYQMFTNNQLDSMTGSREYTKKLQSLADNGKYKALKYTSPYTRFMVINVDGKNKLLMNSNIRKALSLAVDRDTYTNKISKSGSPAYGLIPPGLMCADKEYRNEVSEPLKNISENPKELFIKGLKELNMNPDPTKITLKYLIWSDNAADRADAEYFQNQWETKIGCKFKIETCADNSDYAEKTSNGKYEVALTCWGADFNDPFTFTGLFTKNNSNNLAKFSDSKYEELCSKVLSEQDTDKKIELYKEAEEILVKDKAIIIPLYYSKKEAFINNKIEGLQYPLFGGTYELRWSSIK